MLDRAHPASPTRTRVLVPTLGVVALLACGEAPRPQRGAAVPVLASSTPSVFGSMSGSAVASSSTAPPALCLDGPPTGAVGYDAATDVITVCSDAAATKGACVAFPRDAPGREADPPVVALKELVKPVFARLREPSSIERVGARLVVKDDPKRWVAMAGVAPPGFEGVQALWTSANGRRALVTMSVRVCTGVMHLSPGVTPSDDDPSQKKTRCVKTCRDVAPIEFP